MDDRRHISTDTILQLIAKHYEIEEDEVCGSFIVDDDGTFDGFQMSGYTETIINRSGTWPDGAQPETEREEVANDLEPEKTSQMVSLLEARHLYRSR